jgi:hypothetical protein
VVNYSSLEDEILVNYFKSFSIIINKLDLSLKYFNTTEDLNRYVSGDDWGKGENPKLCFGFSFRKTAESKYNYSLHFFDAVALSNATSDIPNQQIESLNPFQNGPDLDSFTRYTYSGYLNMMTIINNLILNLETNSIFNPQKVNVAIGAQKYYTFKQDQFGEIIGLILPFFLVIAYVCPLCVLVFRIVSEKVNFLIR